MIRAFVSIGFRELSRRRAELLLTFVVPVVFFSIFAMIFGGQGSSTPDVNIAVVDLDGSAVSKKVIRLMEAESALSLRAGPVKSDGRPLTVEDAETLVKDGDVSIAVVLERGFGERVPSFFGNRGDAVRLLRDPADPIASNVVSGLLQQIVMGGLPDRMAASGLDRLDDVVGELTPEQSRRRDEFLQFIDGAASNDATTESATEATGAANMGSPVKVAIVDVVGEGKTSGMVSYYAAAIAVMFLLFSSSGAGGALIEEEQNGTLERLLTTRVTMTTLLLGKGAFLVVIGVIQIVVMFLWGWLVFGLELFDRLPGFFAMTLLTAVAASAFGLLLATICRSRAQLAGVSTIVILTMSAMGGSMFPRFLMSETMQKMGYATFNAWALEGFLKVFWRDEPVTALWPQAVVLIGIALGMFGLARLFARRWESV